MPTISWISRISSLLERDYRWVEDVPHRMRSIVVLVVFLAGVAGMAQPQPADIKVRTQTVVECGWDDQGHLISRFGVVAVHGNLRYPIDTPKGTVRPASRPPGPQDAIGRIDGGVFRPKTMFPAISTAVVPPPPGEPVRRRLLVIFADFPDSRWNLELKEK